MIIQSEIQNSRLTLWLLVTLVFISVFLGISVLGASFRLTLNYIVCGEALTFPGTEACPRKNRPDP